MKENDGCCSFFGGCMGCMGCLTRIVIPWFIGCLVAEFICNINPAETYSWYSGIWHGIFFAPNLVRSWFENSLYKAKYYTTAYNVWWWITIIWEFLSFFGYRNRNNF